MKKVLIVSYYSPPVGMSGVMRITKFAKYLLQFGWQPYILTTKPIAYYHYDYELLNDLKDIKIYRSESLDLARLSHLLKLPKPAIKTGTGQLSMLSNFLFYPDAKSPWIPFAYRLGCKVVEQEKPDLIFATAPPFSALMIGYKLKQRYDIPLVIDFRDPWPTGFVPPPRILKNRIVKLKERIINQSDSVIAVNRETAEKTNCPGATIIENGYDPAEFAVSANSLPGFNIVHAGNIWDILNQLVLVTQTIADILGVRLTLVGNCDNKTLHQIRQYKNVDYLGARSHSETIAIMKGASLLLYLSKPNQAVGIKLYEYFGAGKPILGICSDCNEAMRLIENHRVGLTISPQKEEIIKVIQSVRNNKFPYSPVDLDRYNRINQTKHLAEIFNQLIS